MRIVARRRLVGAACDDSAASLAHVNDYVSGLTVLRWAHGPRPLGGDLPLGNA